MIRTILFLYSILSVTMAANQGFTVTSDGLPSFTTQNSSMVAALMGRGDHPPHTQQNLEEVNHHLRSTVDYLGRTVDQQYHTIEEQAHIIARQEAEIARLRWSLAQAHRDGPPPPPYSPPPLTSGGTYMEAPLPYHKRGSDDTVASGAARPSNNLLSRSERLENNPLYKEFMNHTLIQLLAIKEAAPRRNIMINIVIGRKIIAERKGTARAESINYFQAAQAASENKEPLEDLWKFATIGLGLAYCDNRENLRGLFELHKLKEETTRFVNQQGRIAYFQTSLDKDWKNTLKVTDWLKGMSPAEQEKVIQTIIEATKFYGLIR